ncbi:protoheme IX farnesyltransferase, mitochondrial-like [Salvia hispanica]|uniref:protoheme IX farnesyltransferase, mitochondrial-like n=1 Tax=Salvia hispanica TaxID=49212 RepID=UPI002009CDD5|nr:protoheme IX farnesyltransferase, mitochondrial-like [Salvia hispanica]
MWRRNSLSLSSNLARLNSNPSPFLFLRTSHSHGALARSNSAAPESTSAADPVTWSQSGPDVRCIATPPAVGLVASASAGKAKELADLVRHYSRCYWELSKARLSMLVVATSGTGYILGSGSSIDYIGLCCTCAGTMMVAAAANSLNQVFEVKNDARMNRTRLRPLPSGRITRPHAVMWASSMGIAGTALLACEANMLAAGLAASNLILYAFVYTPLKQIHPVNTWVGAIVGAIPPLLGWAAASGQISLNSMMLPAALYFWQLPHFMALAYLCRKDYADGGFKMFSLADPSGYRTAWVALRNCLYMLPLGYLAYDWGIASGWFCVESTLLALAISSTAGLFLFNRTTKNARRMFHASLLYLPVFMGGLLVHRCYDNELSATVKNSNQLAELPSSSSLEGDWTRSSTPRINRRPAPSRPPVAYASVAPFPFLPAPYVSN